MPATANFKAAMQKANRKPVTVVGVENPSALKQYVTTKSDFDASKILDHIDTAKINNSAVVKPEVARWVYANPQTWNTERVGETLTLPYNGKLYVFGGVDSTGMTYPYIREYDPATNTWVLKNSNIGVPGGLTGFVIGTKAYIVGASNTNTWEYDFVNNTWTTKLTSGVDRSYMTGGGVYNGKMYIWVDASITAGTRKVFEYNPGTNAWTLRSNGTGPAARKWSSACVVGNKLYVFGGATTVVANDLWECNLDTFAWTQKASAATGAYALMLLSYKGYVYAMEGCRNWMYEPVLLNQRYNPNTNTWENLFAPLATAHRDSVNSRHWLSGGSDANGMYWYGGRGQLDRYGTGYPEYMSDVVEYKEAATIRTRNIDMTFKPTAGVYFEFDDIVPSGTTLTFSARGSDDGSNWTNLGTVADGITVAGYRYYDVDGYFTSNATTSPELQEIRANALMFEFYSDKEDRPSLDVPPYLVPRSINALTSKADISKTPTSGELSFKLFWNSITADRIAAGYLKNKAIFLQIGEESLTAADYFTIFTGTWYDYEADHAKGTFTVKTRDSWRKFASKIPKETTDANGLKTTTPRTWTAANMIQAMLDIFEYIGVSDRFINRTSFTDLNCTNGPRDGADWNVTRTISSPIEASKLLVELGMLAGVFMVITSDGKLTLMPWDSSTPTAATFDAASDSKFGVIQGGQNELSTRQLAYYSMIAGKTGDAKEDYNKALIKVNVTSEIRWNEWHEKEVLDKWNATTYALTQLCNRLDEWHANPKATVKVTAPPWFIDVEPGQYVAVDNLKMPVPSTAYSATTTYAMGDRIIYNGKAYESKVDSNLNSTPDANPTKWKDMGLLSSGLSYQKKFLVTSKTVDVQKLQLSFDLREV